MLFYPGDTFRTSGKHLESGVRHVETVSGKHLETAARHRFAELELFGLGVNILRLAPDIICPVACGARDLFAQLKVVW